MNTTIAAIATGLMGSVGIVRVSGPLAVTIAQKTCSPFPKNLESHKLYLGHLLESPNQASTLVDQVMFCLMIQPRSYTGEDVLEIHAHGGAVNLNRVLKTVLDAGAVLALPGEFTRRSFLNKKMDLTQAEAIASLIGAQSTLAVKQAQKQLLGELGAKVRSFQEAILQMLGKIEGALDFPDLEDDETLMHEVLLGIDPIEKECHRLAQSFDEGGRFLVSGLDIALLGKTNAGKSSLLNALCGMERMLVDDKPGTTRDYVEVSVDWGAIKATLIDTAGLRKEQTLLEQQGSFLAQKRWKQAAFILLVTDSTCPLGEEEQEILQQSALEKIPVLMAWNKVDLSQSLPPPNLQGVEVISCSALCGTGIRALKEKILSMVVPGIEEEQIILNTRQARLMTSIYENLSKAKQLANPKSIDLLASVLRDSLANLKQLSGDSFSYDVLDQVFSQFCIGK